MTPRQQHKERGFTLVEIAVAITIFGLAFAQIIAWQTRQLDMYMNERSRIQAALYAQYLMTLIEVEDSPPDLGTEEGKLEERLRDEGFFEDDKVEEKTDTLRDWKFQQTVSKIDVAPRKDVLRRIELQISWGEGGDQNFSLLYFVRTNSSGEGGEESNSEDSGSGDEDA